MCARRLAENDGVKYGARPVGRDDASIVPYRLFAAFASIGKVSPRHDEGIVPCPWGGKFAKGFCMRFRNGQDRSLQSGLKWAISFIMYPTRRGAHCVKRNIGNSREGRWVTVCGYGVE